MSVRLQLDQEPGHTYTNLDYVTGKAILTLPTDATIAAITVKLEAESKTRLAGPKSQNDQDRKRTELELHKLLYKVQTVFPAPELRESTRNPQFTLLRGQYEYPFQFKLPFNTDCTNNTSLIKNLKVGQLTVQVNEEPSHTKNPLPPTLGGYPGEAYIKYFVKATVVRPKFYQENLRSEHDFKFLPIEPPRPPDRQQEAFARRKHQFAQFNGLPKKQGLLRKNSASSPEEEPLSFQIDARLPNPPIITCQEPLPIRILVEKLNQSTASVYLSMIQIELIGHTRVRANDLDRVESSTWLLVSQANMNVPIDQGSKKSSSVWTIPSRFWDQVPLPSTVTPSFNICNLSRRYELEIRVGLAHGMADGVRPELIVSPLRLDVEVYSGIAPPPKLLQAMASQRQPKRDPQKAQRPNRNKLGSPTQVAPETPSSPLHANSYASPSRLDSQSSSNNYLPPEDEDDLPPSYEDAIAEDIAPVDGPRREYTVPESPDRPAFNPDSKTSLASSTGLGRRVSERLFSQNAPRPPESSRDSAYRRAFSNAGFNQTGLDIREEPENISYDGYDRTRSASIPGSNGITNQGRDDNEDEGPRPALPIRKGTAASVQTGVEKR